jgi:membrane protein implicated in regulation of membrane protease activity
MRRGFRRIVLIDVAIAAALAGLLLLLAPGLAWVGIIALLVLLIVLLSLLVGFFVARRRRRTRTRTRARATPPFRS